MKKLLLVWIVIVAIGVGFGQTRKELAYDVVGSQLAYSHYQMCVESGECSDDERRVEALGIEIDNACMRLVDPMFRYTDKFMQVCRLNVCYQLGIPFSSCL